MLWSGCIRMTAWRNRRGVTSLEFALVAFLLLMLLLGASEAARYMMTVQSLRSVSGEAVRLVALRGGANINAGNTACSGLSGTLSGAGARVAFLDAASLRTTMMGCTTDTNGVTTVTVTVSYPFTYQVTYFGTERRSLSETSQALFN